MDNSTPAPASITRLDMRNQDRRSVLLFVIGTSFILYVAMLCIACNWASEKSYASSEPKNELLLNAALLHFGIVCGWLIGGILSPDNKEEEVRFARYSTAIASFVSGYLLSKIDGSISKSLEFDNWSSDGVIHMLLWTTGALTAMLFTFTLRTYILRDQSAKIRTFALTVPPNDQGTAMFGQTITDDTRLQLHIKKGDGELSVSRQVKPGDAPSQVFTLQGKYAEMRAIELGAKGKYFVLRNKGNAPLLVRVKVFVS